VATPLPPRFSPTLVPSACPSPYPNGASEFAAALAVQPPAEFLAGENRPASMCRTPPSESSIRRQHVRCPPVRSAGSKSPPLRSSWLLATPAQRRPVSHR
jgi:hypothetical protein